MSSIGRVWFFVGNRTLRPRDSEGGWWVISVDIEVKLLEGVRVVVDVDEGVGWKLVVWCVCRVDVGVVVSKGCLEPLVVLRGPFVWCPGRVWCVRLRYGCVGVCMASNGEWVKSWWKGWWNAR